MIITTKTELLQKPTCNDTNNVKILALVDKQIPCIT
jgi:hypothetical protein